MGAGTSRLEELQRLGVPPPVKAGAASQRREERVHRQGGRFTALLARWWREAGADETAEMKKFGG